MKIVQLLYHLASGGAERFVVDLSNELAHQGNDVTVIMLRDASNPVFSFNKPFLSSEVKLVSLAIPEGFKPSYIPVVEKAILAEKPDVVHAHLNILPYVFSLALRHREIKFIHTIHNVATFENPSKAMRALCGFFYRKGIITPVAISQKCRESFVEAYRIKNVRMVDNGRSVPEKSSEFEKVQKELSTQQHPIFVHVARYSAEKNQQMLVEAFNAINDNYTLYIIGRGFDKAPQLKANGKIHFLGEKSNVADYLYCSDAFCLSSLVEGLPISLLEAMACGLTPICTRAGGIPDVIEDGKTGYLSKDFTAQSYTQAINRFMQKPLDKAEIIKAYQIRFSIESCANKYIEVYNETL